MTIDFDDDESRLLYAVVLEKAQEHFSYANTSDVGDRLCKLAARLWPVSRVEGGGQRLHHNWVVKDCPEKENTGNIANRR